MIALEPTRAQTLTADDLRDHIEGEWRSPATLKIVPYGTGGDVRAILSADDNPAPNPIRRIWGRDGCAYIVESENDYSRWLESFNDRTFVTAVERVDDIAYVIHSGGSYIPATD